MRKVFLILLVVGIPLLPGCDAFDDDASVLSIETLTGERWLLIWAEDAEGRRRVPQQGEVYWTEFTPEGKLMSSDACNWCGGAYQTDRGRRLSITMGACTEMACSPRTLGYSDVMNRTTTFDLKGARLRLHTTTSDGSDLMLVHAAVAP